MKADWIALLSWLKAATRRKNELQQQVQVFQDQLASMDTEIMAWTLLEESVGKTLYALSILHPHDEDLAAAAAEYAPPPF